MRIIIEVIVGILCCFVVMAICDLAPGVNLEAKNYYAACFVAGSSILLFSIFNPPKKSNSRGNYKPLGNHD